MKLVYRKDIDGLRTLAVGLVVFYHLGLNIPGGFIGVDIFFVISGFLITSIIFNEIKEKNFLFSNFYKRRLKRIFPLYIFISSVTIIVFYFVMVPDDFNKLLKSYISGMLSLSNMYFIKESTGYFSSETELFPLLHTWSLSVEEQFYFIWPILLIGLLKLKGNKLYTGVFTLLFILICISEIITVNSSRVGYYFLLARGHELLAGAILGVLLSDERFKNKINSYNTLFSFLFLFFIIYSIVYISKDDYYPGYLSIFPTLGTVFFIISRQDSFVNKLFSIKPMVYLGQISYSIYLWHWPIIVYFNYTGIEIKSAEIFYILFFVFTLSSLSYRFVEVPFIRFNFNFKSVLIYYYMIPLLIISVVVFAVPFDKLINARISSLGGREQVKNAIYPDSNSGWCQVSEDRDVWGDENCILGSNGSKLKGLLWGDSHAAHFAPAINQLGEIHNFSVYQRTLAQCVPLITSGNLGRYSNMCSENREFIKTNIKNYDFIYLASRWESRLDIFGDVEDTVKWLSNNIKDVYIISQVPLFESNVSKCILRKTINSSVVCNMDVNSDYRKANLKLSEMSDKYKNVHFISLDNVFCKGGECSPLINGSLSYFDSNHLSENGSLYLTPHIPYPLINN
ncbi:acyltransferase [Moritella marina ATCC 15381]|uniref:Acyltransferase n=1 Tax=Moritella marina ATCC 15381 TaxID=1202962 RepID=A0A5J6WQ68_MORMI|nr:acyltransferase family protein [Moritella marina]QFI40137.1 acyltransferase [Moritella marina ATCC 15381]